jgi:hypothetical protein
MLDWVYDVVQWLLDGLKWPFLEGFRLLLGALAGVIEAIPAPEWVGDMAGYAQTIASGPGGWAWSMLGVSEGLAIIASAYTIRFIIRRLPVVG